jgi:hypothetical protein
MRRDPLDQLRLMDEAQAPNPEFATQLERRIRRALEPILPGGDDVTEMQVNPLNRHGHLSYIEMPALDATRSADFYESVFGWTIRARDAAGSSFTDPNGDLIGHFVTGVPIAREPSLQLFISVDDVRATLERIVALGGQIVKEPYPEGALTVATFRDPAGNVMGIWQT